MKILISESVEKSLLELGFSIQSFLSFLRKHSMESARFVQLCSPLPDTVVYKAYLDGVTRVIVFVIIGKGLAYPVYVGDKHDLIGRNVTVSVIRGMAERWQSEFLRELREKKIKVRHIS